MKTTPNAGYLKALKKFMKTATKDGTSMTISFQGQDTTITPESAKKACANIDKMLKTSK